MRSQSARGLDAEASRHAGNENAFAREVNAAKHLVRGGFRAECLGHSEAPVRWEEWN
jgi:hypothetical protein